MFRKFDHYVVKLSTSGFGNSTFLHHWSEVRIYRYGMLVTWRFGPTIWFDGLITLTRAASIRFTKREGEARHVNKIIIVLCVSTSNTCADLSPWHEFEFYAKKSWSVLFLFWERSEVTKFIRNLVKNYNGRITLYDEFTWHRYSLHFSNNASVRLSNFLMQYVGK